MNIRSYSTILVLLLSALPAIAAQQTVLPTPKPTPAPPPTSEKTEEQKRAKSIAANAADQVRHRNPKENRAAFEWVLSKTLPPDRNPPGEDYGKEGRRYFLFLAWLNYGDPLYGREYSLAENGRDWGKRIFHEGGIQGGDQGGQDAATCRELRTITSLPRGLPNAYAVPYSRILIVGLRTGNGGKWQVRCYDRENLPKQVQTITRLTKNPCEN